MKIRSFFLLAVLVLLASIGCHNTQNKALYRLAVTTVYISHAGAGSMNGTSCSDAEPYSYFNNSSNWTSSPSGIQIGPGAVVHLCSETYVDSTADDTALQFQCATASGTSANPITLIADQGVTNLYNSAYWNGDDPPNGPGGAIWNTGSCTYVVINGDNNLTIANQTSNGSPTNGTGLENSTNSAGIYMGNCTYCTIENVTVKNIYVNQGSSSGASDSNGINSAGIGIVENSTGSVIKGNTITSASVGIQLATDPNGDASNTFISNNTISDSHWSINVGGGDSGDTINPVNINGNNITNWTNWQFPTSAYHTDGIILYNVGNPSAGIIANIYDNYTYGNLGVGSPTGFIYCADFSSCTLFNNIIVNTGNTIYGLMWLGQSSDMGTNMNVYNNTIIGATSNDVCIMLNITGAGNIENNICTGPSGMDVYNSYWSSLSQFEATVSTSNYNDWNIGSGNAWGSQASSATASYASWKSAGYEANSIQSSPDLNSGPYTLASRSPSIGLGSNLTSLGIAELKVGAPQTFGASGSCGSGCLTRVASGAWDAGAYPYTE